jgi:hypothetical protein
MSKKKKKPGEESKRGPKKRRGKQNRLRVRYMPGEGEKKPV